MDISKSDILKEALTLLLKQEEKELKKLEQGKFTIEASYASEEMKKNILSLFSDEWKDSKKMEELISAKKLKITAIKELFVK